MASRRLPHTGPHPSRVAFGRRLAGRFWLRFHAALIVAGTFGAGFVASLILLHMGLDALLPRWLIAIAFAYLVFFALVRLWLAYIGAHRLPSPDAPDVDAALPEWPGSVRMPELPFRGHGGGFGGAGASGEFGATHAMHRAADGTQSMANALTSTTRPVGSGVIETGSDALGYGFDVDADGFLIGVLIAIALLLIAVLAGSAIHFIWVAPDLLADAAFAAMLSSGALPGLARAEASNWNGHVLRATWIPFAGVTVTAVICALVLGHYFPDARTFGEAWSALR